jgi:hypothetical protein
LGDTVQFCRYLPLLEATGAHVVFAAQNKLGVLVRTVSPTVKVVGFDKVPARFDCHCYLMSLPLAFGTSVETIPATVPYLTVEAARIERWRRRLGTHGLKIGLCWQGNARNKDEFGRPFPLAALADLARLPGVRLISLQKEAGTEQLATLPEGMTVETLGEKFDAGPDAFLDSAAVIQCLDLVISCDTAIAHLAGALGRPVWLALKAMPDWRWMTGRTDSPWYPTARLFRQRTPGDWAPVFAEMVQAVAGRLAMAAPGKAAGFPTPTVPVSWGELVDKITILEIKSERLSDDTKRANVVKELNLLADLAALHPEPAPLADLRGSLKTVNTTLWEVEDRLRDKEAAGLFDEEFIALARAVYKHNDHRAALKRVINELLGSELVEEKSYARYGEEP